MGFILAWTMTCTHYYEAVDRLYKAEYFKQPEQHQAREQIHRHYKRRTPKKCHTELAGEPLSKQSLTDGGHK